jgi:hypothetical protein
MAADNTYTLWRVDVTVVSKICYAEHILLVLWLSNDTYYSTSDKLHNTFEFKTQANVDRLTYMFLYLTS